MILIPAVDILGGRPVRLLRGDYGQATQYGESPLEAALRWQDAGARWLHVVDLDGARAGRPVNVDAVNRIVQQTSLRVQVGGGLRTQADVADVLLAGADRAVLGTAALRTPEVVRALCEQFPGRVVVALDARGGNVALEGWTAETSVTVADAATAAVKLGTPRLLFTVIERDGTQEGPDLAALESLLAAVNVPVIASGGVGTVEDLEALEAIGVEAVVVGRALYEGVLPATSIERYAGASSL